MLYYIVRVKYLQSLYFPPEVCSAHKDIPQCVQIACKNSLNFSVNVCSVRIHVFSGRRAVVASPAASVRKHSIRHTNALAGRTQSPYAAASGRKMFQSHLYCIFRCYKAKPNDRNYKPCFVGSICLCARNKAYPSILPIRPDQKTPELDIMQGHFSLVLLTALPAP